MKNKLGKSTRTILLQSGGVYVKRASNYGVSGKINNEA